LPVHDRYVLLFRNLFKTCSVNICIRFIRVCVSASFSFQKALFITNLLDSLRSGTGMPVPASGVGLASPLLPTQKNASAIRSHITHINSAIIIQVTVQSLTAFLTVADCMVHTPCPRKFPLSHFRPYSVKREFVMRSFKICKESFLY